MPLWVGPDKKEKGSHIVDPLAMYTVWALEPHTFRCISDQVTGVNDRLKAR